jgi:hypothetical protein
MRTPINYVTLRRARATVAERDAMAQDTEEAQKKKEAEAEERKKQSHDMVAESIRRELAESMRICSFSWPLSLMVLIQSSRGERGASARH